MNTFTQRSITAFFFVLVLLGSIFIGPYTYGLLFLFIVLKAGLEFSELAAARHISIQQFPALTSALYLFTTCFLAASGFIDLRWAIIGLPLLGLTYFFTLQEKFSTQALMSMSASIAQVIYTALPFALLNFMVFHQYEYHYDFLLGTLLLIWANDTFAYLVGSVAGKRKLVERISPKKTIEGTAGGILFTFLTAGLLVNLLPVLSLSEWMVMGLIVAISGTLGDLTESALKRDAGVKDSGRLMPGHGGILDRFDSLMVALPFVFAYLFFIGKVQFP
jgi:phosphatidate cytidylyltransferase